MEYFSKRTGICLFVIGIAMFLLNYFTSTWWNMDIDILGAMIAVLGLVIAIASNKMKKSKRKPLYNLHVLGGQEAEDLEQRQIKMQPTKKYFFY